MSNEVITVILNDLSRVAEAHYFLRPLLIKSLEKQELTDEAKLRVGQFSSYLEYWRATYSEQFYDMTIMVRLGSSIENGLRDYFMHQRGIKSLIKLRADPNYENNIFQRVLPWTKNNVLSLYREVLGIDLLKNSYLSIVQETMLHRHLYVHNSGLIDSRYIKQLKELTGVDVTRAAGMSGFPREDVYWMEPLKRLHEFIEGSRNFFSTLP